MIRVSEPMTAVDRSEVRDGNLGDLQSAARHLAEVVASDEARPIVSTLSFDDEAVT